MIVMMNKLIYQGRLTEGPVLNYTRNKNTPVVNFTLASDSKLKNEDGERITNFQRFTAYNERAEHIAKYYQKGQLMLVEASLEENYYLDKNHKKCKEVYGLVNEVHFCDRNKKEEESVTESNFFEPPKPDNPDEAVLTEEINNFSDDISNYDDFI